MMKESRWLLCRGSVVRHPKQKAPTQQTHEKSTKETSVVKSSNFINLIPSSSFSSDGIRYKENPLIYWRFCERSKNLQIKELSNDIGSKIQIRTKNWANNGIDGVGLIEAQFNGLLVNRQLSINAFTEKRIWRLPELNDCPIASENEWGEKGDACGSVRVGSLEMDVFVVVEYGGPLIKLTDREWSAEVWIKLESQPENSFLMSQPTTWTLLKLNFCFDNNDPMIGTLKVKAVHGEINFVWVRTDFEQKETSFPFFPAGSNDGGSSFAASSHYKSSDLLFDQWMFIAISRNENGSIQLISYVKNEWMCWSNLQSEVLSRGGSNGQVWALDHLELGGRGSLPFELTEFRFFSMARPLEIVKEKAFVILDDAILSQSNMIKKMRINLPDDKLQQIRPVLCKIPASTVTDLIRKRRHGLTNISPAKLSPLNNNRSQANQRPAEANKMKEKGTVEDKFEEIIDRVFSSTSRSLDTMDGEISPVVSKFHTRLDHIDEENAHSEKKDPHFEGKDPLDVDHNSAKREHQLSSITDDKTRQDAALKQITHHSINSDDDMTRVSIEEKGIRNQIESFYSSKFLFHKAKEFLYSLEKVPYRSEDFLHNEDPVLLLLLLNHHLNQIQNFIISAKSLQAYHDLQKCLSILSRPILDILVLPIATEERVIQTEDHFHLVLGVELKPFSQSYICRLYRHHRLYSMYLPHPNWRRLPHAADVLQAHVAAISRCLLVLRLCLVALQVFCAMCSLKQRAADEDSSTALDSPKKRVANAHEWDPAKIWMGLHWDTFDNLSSFLGQKFNDDEQTILRSLWIRLIAILCLIWSAGLPFGLPLNFCSSLAKALSEIKQHQLISVPLDKEEIYDSKIGIGLCFMSGVRLDKKKTIYCPICCSTFSLDVIRSTSSHVNKSRCPYCFFGIINYETEKFFNVSYSPKMLTDINLVDISQ